ncbi:MAG: glucose-6-phosphate dehydrogenase [Planctomycetota bacterium]|nr:glucose-6-phosphate dehydrogenase [Planctomycetota bacterium]MDA1179552.1 glucose-6-phosphate dehydrogenase [Planctomycetota bacterium]
MPLTFVILGATGDLTSRKLIPALYELHRKKKLSTGFRVLGAARTVMTDEQWREKLQETSPKFLDGKLDEQAWQDFASRVHYQPLNIRDPEDFQRLAARCAELEGTEKVVRVYYLATAPELYGDAVTRLGAVGLADETDGARRIVIEKPFGVDLSSARALNDVVHKVFPERQIFRIDHYLGKETVQNLLVLRFANTIFEPVWNRNYVDHVQITVAEDVDVGQRGDYYDGAGVLRDMFQNHLLQLMTITAMEAPVRFEADAVRDEKVKVLRSIKPLAGADFAQHTFRGQYQGYRDISGVLPDSETATFAALRLHIDNWRWQGVPFYLRSGKALSCRTTQIVVQFRRPPHILFDSNGALEGDRLVVQVQPAEGIQLHFQTKVPDAGMRLRLTDLAVDFRREFSGPLPDAYQRLLLDAASGDASLFARSDEVEVAWSIIDPIHASWKSPAAPRLEVYEAGFWGPPSCTQWLRDQGREWFDVCPVLN